MYRVQQTECRTGWLVVDAAGRAEPYSIRRQREAATQLAATLNGCVCNHVDLLCDHPTDSAICPECGSVRACPIHGAA